MSQALTQLLILLRPKTKGLARMFRAGPHKHPYRALGLLMLAGLFAYGIFVGSVSLLDHVMSVELIGQLIPKKLMSMVLLILMSILLISTTISSFSIIFLSDDLELLMSSPITMGSLFYARLIEMVVVASWMVLFFGLPILLAFGKVYQAGLPYFLMVVLLFPALILIPGALGAIISVLLTRVFSARRSRDLLVILVVLGFIAIYLLIRTLQPERLLDQDSFGTMVEFLEMFRSPESRWLPTQWMTNVLFPLLEQQSISWMPAIGLWSTAGALCVIAGWLGTMLYASAYNRSQINRVHNVGRSKKRSRLLGPWLDRWSLRIGGLTAPLMVKDLRVFMRDTNQWLQLLLLGALAAVYVLNFSYLKLADFNWFILYTINHAMVGLVMAGIGVRFVFPAISLEGRAWWIVRNAPIRLSALMHSKLIIHFVPLALVGTLLSILSCAVIDVPLAFGVISVGLVLAGALCISSIGVGLGAVFPKFEAENPAKIPTGIGGVTFMISSMSFILVFLLTSVYPTFVLYRWPTRLHNPVSRPVWLAASLFFLVMFTLCGCYVPMWLGKRQLLRREEE